jgi:sarcosine oxidase / L-pipecolate oxidase
MASTTWADHQQPALPHLIIGAGVFGLSLAHELARRGHAITVLDRQPPPVPDGSSVDISRIIRADYASPLYHRLALEALTAWNRPHDGHDAAHGGAGWAPWYRPAGFVLMGRRGAGAGDYVEACKRNLHAQGVPIREFAGAHDFARQVPQLGPVRPELEGYSAYRNPMAGWADAGGAVAEMARRCRARGVRFQTGEVARIVVEGGRATGVVLVDGRAIRAEQVTVATGAWTGYLLDMRGTASASAQPVAWFRVNEAEAEELKDLPVVLDLTTGWFVFPPTKASEDDQGAVIKIARHGYGYATKFDAQPADKKKVISAPKLVGDNSKSSFIPDDAKTALREGLKWFLPRYAEKSFEYHRLCWYTDTPEGDFIIDWHPNIKNLFVLTGGSGQ